MSSAIDEIALTTLRPRLNIGVVGGSLGGLFAAALLTRNGHNVTVFERSPRGLATAGAGVVAREEVFDILRSIRREDAGRIGIVADERVVLDLAGEVIERDLSRQFQLSWDHLYEVLREEVPSADYILGQSVHTVHPGERYATVEFADGSEQRFDLVVGADGPESVTRKTVVSGRRTNSYAGYATWSGLVPENELHRTAADSLLDRVTSYTSRDNQVLGYLVPGSGGEIGLGSRRYEWLWTRAMSADDLARVIADSGSPDGSFAIARGALPEVLRRRLANEAEENLPFPFWAAVSAEPSPSLRPVFDYVAPQMTAPRVALVGDAAVIVRPHAAMSTAKAAGDAAALASYLEELPVDEALSAYERDRLAVGKSIASYGRIFANSAPLNDPAKPADAVRQHESGIGKK